MTKLASTKQRPILNHETYYFKNALKENKNTANFSSLQLMAFKSPKKSTKTTAYFFVFKLARKVRWKILRKIGHSFSPGVSPQQNPEKATEDICQTVRL